MTTPEQDRVELTVDGRVHAGWQSVSIDTGIDELAFAFTLGLSERWPGQPERFTLKAGASAKVTIGGETVVTGFIDRLESQLDGETHTITISGRSKAADLIDCSAVAKPGQWRGLRLEAIAAELAKPFGITVTAIASTGAPFKLFALQQGESVHDAIERMARMRGLLVISDADGNLKIVSPEPIGAGVRIVQGQHPLSISASHDVSDRFASYVVKGQAAGDDDANGKVVSEPSASATDPGVTRYRPLIVIAEDQADIATLRARAAWEAIVRAAKAQEASVTLNGWRTPAGKLWSAMTAVALDAPAAWMQAGLMVSAVNFSLDDQGRKVTLRLVLPEAYSQLPVPEKAESSAIGKPKKAATR